MGMSWFGNGCAAEKVNMDGRSLMGELLSSFVEGGGADSVRSAVLSELEWSRISTESWLVLVCGMGEELLALFSVSTRSSSLSIEFPVVSTPSNRSVAH